jgi:hypothetical protein
MRYPVTAFLIAIMLISCGKDDDPMLQSTGDPATFVGTWTINTTELQLYVHEQPLKEYLMGTGMSASDAQNEVDKLRTLNGWEDLFTTFDFTSDGKWLLQTHTSSGTGKWKITSDQKELTLFSDAENKDRKADVISLSATSFQIEMILGTTLGFGKTIDNSVLIKGTRTN